MKRKKVLALLLISGISANLMTPAGVMAEVLQFKIQWEELGCLLTRQSGFLRYKRFLFGTKLFR